MCMTAGQTYSRKSDGLSGDIVMSLFEDREGNIWVATTGGLDRFRELPATTISVKQGLSSDAVNSVVASADGSIWLATYVGLTRWKDGQATIFRKADGLPDDFVQSLFQDDRGQIWATFAGHGLGYFKDDRFVAVHGRAQHRSVFHYRRQGGQRLAFRQPRSLPLAGRTFDRAFPLVSTGTTSTSKSDSLRS